MKTRHSLLLGLFIIAAGIMSYETFFKTDSIKKDQKALYIKGGDFSLPSTRGENFSLQNARGQPVVLYFGFTHCPDICPVGLAVIRDALKSDPAFRDVVPVFATIDPARDTLERLTEYLDFFHPSIIGLSSSLPDIQQLAKQYSTYFKALEPDEQGQYNVDHTAYFYIIDRQGELVRVLDHDTDAAGLSSVLAKFY